MTSKDKYIFIFILACLTSREGADGFEVEGRVNGSLAIFILLFYMVVIVVVSYIVKTNFHRLL